MAIQAVVDKQLGTMLQGQHVKPQEDGSVSLEFTGKKGVDLKIPVTDKKIAADLIARKESAGDSGKIFSGSRLALDIESISSAILLGEPGNKIFICI
jgi:hypothetical protein